MCILQDFEMQPSFSTMRENHSVVMSHQEANDRNPFTEVSKFSNSFVEEIAAPPVDPSMRVDSVRSTSEIQPPAKLRRVLLVDDQKLVIKVNLRMLMQIDISEEYLSCLSGTEAIEIVEKSLAESKPIDIVFLDYVMPPPNGPETASTLRSIGYTGLIIGVTALTELEDKNLFIDHGADLVVSKPLQQEVISQVFERAVNYPRN
jgi:CheY-like chemotaxis protein